MRQILTCPGLSSKESIVLLVSSSSACYLPDFENANFNVVFTETLCLPKIFLFKTKSAFDVKFGLS